MDDHNLNEEQFNKWKQLVEIMGEESGNVAMYNWVCLLYTSPSPRDDELSRMPSSA